VITEISNILNGSFRTLYITEKDDHWVPDSIVNNGYSTSRDFKSDGIKNGYLYFPRCRNFSNISQEPSNPVRS
jgi:hypothetical protein